MLGTKYILIFFIFLLTGIDSSAQIPKPQVDLPDTRILFIFDGSQSMAGYWESDRKITIARNLLIGLIDSLEQHSNVKMALRIYGHQSPVPPQDCSDTRLEVPFAKNNGSRIRQELRFINPKGTTPIANSLMEAANDFPKECDNCRNIIILITDGIEACDGDPCDASYELQRQGIVLKPFVIGIGMDENFKESFECIGQYYNAVDEDQFEDVLGVVITQALNSTTAQVNLLDSYGNPTETDVNMTFYDRLSGNVKHNYIHTINHRGNPDTIILDPLVTYRLRVNTIPPVFVDSFKLYPGKHTIIAADAPQGTLLLKTTGGVQYRDLHFFIRKSGTKKTLNVQKINQPMKYINGTYELEIPVLPHMVLENVEIKPDHTTTIEVPRPGLLNLIKPSNGFGSIYVHRDGKFDWVCNITPEVLHETIVLQPGKYTAVFRPEKTKQAVYTIRKTFDIRSGSSIAVELF
jgi:Ca-activated chloride channel family protein